MTSRAALSEASAPRILVLDDDRSHEVFDVLGITDGVARVRTPFLFELGEQLNVRIEQDGSVSEALARVRAHLGPEDARVTELELSERSEPRRMVNG
jgi:hypothetical protein